MTETHTLSAGGHVIAHIRWEGASPKGMKRQMNNILRDAYLELAKYWHREMLPKHFTLQGAREYGYAKRKGEGTSGKAFWRSYTGQKKKHRGHVLPLVWSGTGMKEAISIFQGRSTYKYGKVHLPRVFNLRHPKSDVDMRSEITAVSARDLEILKREFELLIRMRLEAAGVQS